MYIIERICLWFLLKRKVSVVMNYELSSEHVKPKCKRSYIFGNDFNDCNYLDYEGKIFIVPESKFKIKS